MLGHRLPAPAARRLERQARPYARRGRPVLPAFELIAAIVTSEAGDGGDHSIRQEPSTIRRYLRAARAHRMLLLLDIQPGYAPFLQEAEALEQLLKEPDVSLALDPEWSMEPPQLPGQEIGSTDAATINEVSRYLSGIVRRYDLPQKLLVVHRFTGDMIEAEHDLERHPGVALVVNVDGFGDQPNKISKYHEFTNDLQPPLQRLQALLPGGREPDEAKAGAPPAPPAGPGRLRVTNPQLESPPLKGSDPLSRAGLGGLTPLKGGGTFRLRAFRSVARRLREEVEGGIFHVFARGNGKQAIYLDDDDRPHIPADAGRSVREIQLVLPRVLPHEESPAPVDRDS